MGKLRERLNDPASSGVYRASGEAEVRAEAPAAVTVDLAVPVFDAFAQALDFPQWFGRNWDALEDCLTEKSAVLVIRNAPAQDFGVLADVLAAAAEYWKQQGEPFFAVFVDPERRLALPDLFREK
jgi:RNAse (barnase) inhibitor barstar